jgi:hypothetical protein
MPAHSQQTTLFRLSYISKSNNMLGVIALSHLLNESKKRNRALRVGSILMSTGSEFGQILEGDKETLLAIWASIQLDARHFDVELVSFVPINKRSTLEGCMLFAGNHDLCTRQVLSYINANASELFPELALQAVWKKIKKQIVASAHGTYPEDENSFSTPSTFGPLVGSFN